MPLPFRSPFNRLTAAHENAPEMGGQRWADIVSRVRFVFGLEEVC